MEPTSVHLLMSTLDFVLRRVIQGSQEALMALEYDEKRGTRVRTLEVVEAELSATKEALQRETERADLADAKYAAIEAMVDKVWRGMKERSLTLGD